MITALANTAQLEFNFYKTQITQTAEVYCPGVEVKGILVGKGLNAYKMY